MIRPELQIWFRRHAELLSAGGLAVLGLWWGLRSFGILQMIGWAMVPIGLGWAVIAWRRLRFRSAGRGPGVVVVDEGEVSYFGPLEGGRVQTVELARLVLDPTARPAHWVLEQDGHRPLHIPVNAEGADALFDVFANLPGMRTERMLDELNGQGRFPVVIWQRQAGAAPRHRLH
ncbi:MAG: hypothetical protein HRU31_00105 [Rhodobacteraceae bacterium]|nr:hypothetical protein [Paracoccaceae bacterium]